ncbi:DNA topoisomerase IB [Arthrobacter bambusae]|jgi:DNA topoisomerase I|uniref:DNA topoisomerase IB n=1 Tax=Arthrobacter TaxID=1663 RepID=UPI001F514B1B|nr:MULTISPECIES: DNA topoisomerase IB [Arthrobacter]MCI0140329.1 DNA topoisomerase IB [Arthrobacter bambusae]UYY81706.1 DNA topoisomerase IB [Arthrobacter sp. YA7-1]
MPRLRRSKPGTPGISRRRSGRGFSYYHTDGSLIAGGDRQRLDALAIPPAWADVWICPFENGHIQAMGVDDAGRSQYIYHPEWRARQDSEKFARAARLGALLPQARRLVSRHLRESPSEKTKTLAAAVRLMDLGALRVGSDGYTRRNGSYGLTTLRCKHVQVNEDTVSLNFPGKSGQTWDSTIEDPVLARFLGPLAGRPGKESLLVFDEGEGPVSLNASMVNEYLRKITGGDYTAKDFRTWKGTAAAGMALAGPASKMPPRQRVLEAIKQTAEILGNTPTVARAAYVDPRIVEGFLAGDLEQLKARESDIAAYLGSLP